MYGKMSYVPLGAGYLPLDTSYPTPMLESVLEDSEPTIVITCPDLAPKLDTYSCKFMEQYQNQ